MTTMTTMTTITIAPASHITVAPTVRPESGYFGRGCFWQVDTIPMDLADAIMEAEIIMHSDAALLWGEVDPDLSGVPEIADMTDLIVEVDTARRMITDRRL